MDNEHLIDECERIAAQRQAHRESYCTANGHVLSGLRLLRTAFEECQSCPRKDLVLPQLLETILTLFQEAGIDP